jgi:hypothetical protein
MCFMLHLRFGDLFLSNDEIYEFVNLLELRLPACEQFSVIW